MMVKTTELEHEIIDTILDYIWEEGRDGRRTDGIWKPIDSRSNDSYVNIDTWHEYVVAATGDRMMKNHWYKKSGEDFYSFLVKRMKKYKNPLTNPLWMILTEDQYNGLLSKWTKMSKEST